MMGYDGDRAGIDEELIKRLRARGLLRRPYRPDGGWSSWTMDAPDLPEGDPLPALPEIPDDATMPLLAAVVPPTSLPTPLPPPALPAPLRFLRRALTQGGWWLARLRW